VLLISRKIILAVYYTLADLVLLAQCFWYKGFTIIDSIEANSDIEQTAQANGANDVNERTPFLRLQDNTDESYSTDPTAQERGLHSRRSSNQSFRERLLSLDGTHLSPAVPLLPDPKPEDLERQPPPPQSTLQTIFFNTVIILLVCIAGVLGWYLSWQHSRESSNLPPSDEPTEPESLELNVLGQVFGYICAVLYLGSRIPQLLLNFRRQSTEGISMLFFLFACIGNLTYVMSIFAYDPSLACMVPGKCEEGEAGRMYGRYVLVNLSWLLGSLGTFILDAGVFVQYFLYRKDEDDEDGEPEVRRVDSNEDEAVI